MIFFIYKGISGRKRKAGELEERLIENCEITSTFNHSILGRCKSNPSGEK
jgi:hypothetical protein